MIETLRRLGPARIIALAVVGLGLAGFFVFVTTRLTAPDMALLYGNLDPGDSTQIVQKLEQMGVAYELGGDGTTIRVPADQVLKLRLEVAQDGLPSGGTIGYEIFDRDQPLGTTSFEQQVNRLRALEGELARTIRMIQQVGSARVHLVIPERQLFATEQPKPTASIILTMKGGAVLEKSQVLAIQHLVAAAVPNLKVGDVSVIDSSGNLLAGGDSGDDGMGGGSADDMRLGYENRVRQSIEELLQRSLGYGKVRAEVTAELNFDRITTNSETFDPNGQVVRSTQTVDEKNNSTDSQGSGQVTVANNIPNPNGAPAAATPPSTNNTARTEETVNYEISKQTEVHIQETGQVKKLSVAVLVDGTYATAADGSVTYAPRTPEELDQIGKLVKSAIGFDEQRGDKVEIVNMRFAAPTEIGADASTGLFLGFTNNDVMRMIEVGVLGLLGALALLFGVRPLLTRLTAPFVASAAAQLAGPTHAVQLAGPAPAGGGAQAAMAAEAAADGRMPNTSLANELDRMIDVNQIEGRVRASSLKKVGELVEHHPDEAVNIMRSWMYQDNR
jgi:flagellar M-ring protein FliF